MQMHINRLLCAIWKVYIMETNALTNVTLKQTLQFKIRLLFQQHNVDLRDCPGEDAS